MFLQSEEEKKKEVTLRNFYLSICMFGFLLLVHRMPAYNTSSVFAIFFILYILINTYIFMSVFLAVVYNNYKKYLKVRRCDPVCTELQYPVLPAPGLLQW